MPVESGKDTDRRLILYSVQFEFHFEDDGSLHYSKPYTLCTRRFTDRSRMSCKTFAREVASNREVATSTLQ